MLARCFIAVAQIAVVLAAAVPAQAADWAQDLYNPQPLPDDVVLPMPCGGAMTFRKVVVPSDGPLSDRRIEIGANDKQRGYAEGARPAYIAGTFADGDAARYYLMGKYEVDRLQYQAITAPSCPQPGPDARLPQTEVSWVDAVVFADRYNLWLRKNAFDKLPKADRDVGFARLPTEVEWEYAARGGIAVSAAEFVDRMFPMPEGMSGYVWFSGPQSSNGKAQRIGLLKPNPLGLHDMLGNVDEIMFDPFRLNKLDRLHGEAGGFVVRGGNFATAEADVRTAYRTEVPFYIGKDARRSTTTGFRLVIGAPVITSPARLEAIELAWQALGTQPSGAGESGQQPASVLGEKPLADPVKELQAIANAATDANIKKRLEGLELAFRASFQTQEEQRGRALKARLRLGTFLCQKLKDDGLPIDRLKGVLKQCIDARGADNERCRAQQTLVTDQEEGQWENVRYYADTIVGLDEDYDDPLIDRQLAILKTEFEAGGHQVLVKVADLYRAHALDYRKDSIIARAEWLKQCKAQ